MVKSSAIASMALLSLTTASNINVVSLGSSYAAGPGLTKPYGELVEEMLASALSTQGAYIAAAQSGTNLTSIPAQTKKITSSTNLIVMTSGGNDLNYVGCLLSPNTSVCAQPRTIGKSVWTQRFNESLDAIVSSLKLANVPDPTKIPVYIVTYPIALSKDNTCSPTNQNCPLTTAQIKMTRSKYHKLVDWTVDGLDAWKKDAKNVGYDRFKLIPMHHYSTGHDFEAEVPWLNGAKSPSEKGDGVAWHPNAKGAEAMAKAVVCDYQGKGFPC